MRAAGDPGRAESAGKDIFPVSPVRHAIVYDEIHDHLPGIIGAITDILADLYLPLNMPLDALQRIPAQSPDVADSAARPLFLDELGRCCSKTL
jgi:hypothetical protein